MSQSLMFDNTPPYQFSRDPDRMYAEVPLRRGQPSYRVVAPNEQAYLPFDQRYRVLPREQGFVPVHTIPEEQLYGVHPRKREQLYQPLPRSAPYLAPQVVPEEQAYRLIDPRHQSYVPAFNRGSQPMLEVAPMRDGGYGQRQAYGPVLLPGEEQVWDPRGMYGGRHSDGAAFRPLYEGVGFDQPEPMADVHFEESRPPYYLVRAPRQQGGTPVRVDDASGFPHIVAGGEGKVHDFETPEVGSNLLVRGSEKDRGSVRNIPVTDASSVAAAHSEGAKAKEEEKRKGDGDTKQGLLKKGFLAPVTSRSRSTSPPLERREPETPSGLLRKGFLTSQSKKSSESLPTTVANRSANNGDGPNCQCAESDSTAGETGRVITVPLGELENGNLDTVMKAIRDAVLKEGSKLDGEKNLERSPKASSPKDLDHTDTKKDVVKETSNDYLTSLPSESEVQVVDVNKEEVKTTSEGMKCEGQADVKDETLNTLGEDVKTGLRKPFDEEEAAIRIQASFRGYSLRRTQPLEKARTIAKVRSRLRELQEQVANQEAFLTLMKDFKEGLKLTESVMALLLQLDAIQGVHPMVRDLRKAVARDLTQLQDELDRKLREMAGSTVSSDETEMTAGDSIHKVIEEGELGVADGESKAGSHSSEQAMSAPMSNLRDNEDEVERDVKPAEEESSGQQREQTFANSVVEGAAEAGPKEMLKQESAAAEDGRSRLSPDSNGNKGAVEGLQVVRGEDTQWDCPPELEGVDKKSIRLQVEASCVQGPDKGDLPVMPGRDVPANSAPELDEEVPSCGSGSGQESAVDSPSVETLEDGTQAESHHEITEVPSGGQQKEVAFDEEADKCGPRVVLEEVGEQVEGSAESSLLVMPEGCGNEGSSSVVSLDDDVLATSAPDVDRPVLSIHDEQPLALPPTPCKEANADDAYGEVGPVDTEAPSLTENEVNPRESRRSGSGEAGGTTVTSTGVEADVLSPEGESGCAGLVETERNADANVSVASEGAFSSAAAGKAKHAATDSGGLFPFAPVVEKEQGTADLVEQLKFDPAIRNHADELLQSSSLPAWQGQRCVFEDKTQWAATPDAENVEEQKLMWQLIEENRKLKAMVQTLVGLSQSQTRSMVDRLERLESKVADTSKPRERRARRVVARRRR